MRRLVRKPWLTVRVSAARAIGHRPPQAARRSRPAAATRPAAGWPVERRASGGTGAASAG
ncbi:hypothetical protein ADL27_03680 [Streptomyces sp. NRRL F-6602]|nr:hypothetical protein ADL27_03680 [Streptomyces sp. NRRL F-6602]